MAGEPVLILKSSIIKRLQEEWEEIDLLIRGAILTLGGYMLYTYGHGIVATTFLRTQAEQDNIYLNHPDPDVVAKYMAWPWRSYHQEKLAADIRWRPFNEEMWRDACGFVGDVFHSYDLQYRIHPPGDEPQHVHIEIHKLFGNIQYRFERGI